MKVLVVLSCLVAIGLADPTAYLVKKHNAVRARHHVGPLKKSSILAKKAASCCQRVVDGNETPLDCSEKLRYGENIGVGQGYGGTPGEADTCKQIFGVWYGQKVDYDYMSGRPNSDYTTDGFTQTVWKASTKIGCGYAANTTTNNVACCCLYSERGNNLDTMRENVFPETS